jgi:hypothetical protein
MYDLMPKAVQRRLLPPQPTWSAPTSATVSGKRQQPLERREAPVMYASLLRLPAVFSQTLVTRRCLARSLDQRWGAGLRPDILIFPGYDGQAQVNRAVSHMLDFAPLP